MESFQNGHKFGKWFRQELSGVEDIQELQAVLEQIENRPHAWEFSFEDDDFEAYQTIERTILA